VVQTFHTFLITLPVHQPTPLIAGWDKSRIITSFIISNPGSPLSPQVATPIYLGNNSLVGTPATGNPGIEIPAGSAPSFPIFQESRPEYANVKDDFPYVVWDMSQLWLNTDNGITITVAVFPSMFL